METNTLKKISRLMILFVLGALALACSAEDGTDGTIGPKGTDGIDGNNGQDGNANVQTFVFDVSSKTGTSIQLFIPELTIEFLEGHAILAYAVSGDRFYHMPGPILGSAFIDGSTIMTRVLSRIGQVIITFYDWDGKQVPIEGAAGGSLDEIRIVFIESTSIETIAGKSPSAIERVKTELKSAGVDINNYYSVCEYFGVCED